MKKILVIFAVAAMFAACGPKAAPAQDTATADSTKTECCVKDTTAACCHAADSLKQCTDTAKTECPKAAEIAK